jgi:sorbitol-specific phosphotransferase system component IIA
MAKFVRGVVVSRFGGGEYVVEKVGEGISLLFPAILHILLGFGGKVGSERPHTG